MLFSSLANAFKTEETRHKRPLAGEYAQTAIPLQAHFAPVKVSNSTGFPLCLTINIELLALPGCS